MSKTKTKPETAPQQKAGGDCVSRLVVPLHSQDQRPDWLRRMLPWRSEVKFQWEFIHDVAKGFVNHSKHCVKFWDGSEWRGHHAGFAVTHDGWTNPVQRIGCAYGRTSRFATVEEAKKWVEDQIAPWRDEMLHRNRYGIREATSEELSRMTEEQRWHYHAAAYKPHGMHFENFVHEGRSVRVLMLQMNGEIGGGSKLGNAASLRPWHNETSAGTDASGKTL